MSILDVSRPQFYYSSNNYEKKNEETYTIVHDKFHAYQP